MSTTVTPPPKQTLMTGEEFFTKHEHDHVELVKGIVRELPMTTARHGKISNFFAHYLTAYVLQHDIGHVMGSDSNIRFMVRPDTVYGPDVCYFSYDTMAIDAVPDTGLCNVIPNLVCEVRSPSDLWTEVFAKVYDYLTAGVEVVIVLDWPTQTASVYRPNMVQETFHPGDTLEIPDLFPGFALPVERFFA